MKIIKTSYVSLVELPPHRRTPQEKERSMPLLIMSFKKSTWAVHPQESTAVYLTAKAGAVGSKIFNMIGGVGYQGPSSEQQ